LRLKESEQQQEAKHTHQRYTKAGCEEIEKPQVCIACGAACVGYRMNQTEPGILIQNDQSITLILSEKFNLFSTL
jgi:hypothetical protein